MHKKFTEIDSGITLTDLENTKNLIKEVFSDIFSFIFIELDGCINLDKHIIEPVRTVFKTGIKPAFYIFQFYINLDYVVMTCKQKYFKENFSHHKIFDKFNYACMTRNIEETANIHYKTIKLMRFFEKYLGKINTFLVGILYTLLKFIQAASILNKYYESEILNISNYYNVS
jgi:hypothetical protein